ncbi:hypothetical protein E1A91_D06G145400v1 [Gossypium mustelinum]|uniref:Uncharacterized protein n=1 Tax=Gossypium mustelinum TaxID=34275 RepID=A0A5D2UL23_GOSMU|nr:hypothetical protein E1A91_D06G145400v1 [Gossypium mustelinum]
MALQLRCGGVFLSQLSDSNNKNGRLVIGGVGWGREPFLGRLRCSSNNNNSNCDAKKGVPDSNYVVPLEKSFSPSNSSCITRPLIEILRDLNKRIPHNIIKSPPNSSTFLPWYHANRMLSFYAPGWCGEVRDVIFANNGTITVVYRLTIRGSDGEVLKEFTLQKQLRVLLIFCITIQATWMQAQGAKGGESSKGKEKVIE